MTTMHDLMKKELPFNKLPWDYKIFPPMGLDDEPELLVRIKWKEDGDWEEYRYTVSLALIVETEGNHIPRSIKA